MDTLHAVLRSLRSDTRSRPDHTEVFRDFIDRLDRADRLERRHVITIAKRTRPRRRRDK
ncbi:hypothetical protein A33M_0900 [Rhodovulum sp. PH10]|uniref:hypothetical protein n=1 Tax=Rhodovulum sp. PH10 TaxID=1187851 RepID=UPI00027C2EB8|nr:hypothetical protein [Rhodovulum sp. PH10]EJW09805.1 hypothetical protein A33M_0900 [Rhodovulum sp. PH10]